MGTVQALRLSDAGFLKKLRVIVKLAVVVTVMH